MFAAIRSYWTGERGRKLAGLFAFEFVVVMLGVLAAQWVADWAGERVANEAMEEARSDAYDDLKAAAWEATNWPKVSPCFADRVSELMRVAASGNPVASDKLRRPGIGAMRAMAIDQETLRRIANQHGKDEAENLQAAAVQTILFRERQLALTEAWKSFVQLDPELGAVSASDRAAARAAAAEVLSLLRGLEINRKLLLKRASDLETQIVGPPSGRYARNCDELWAKGSTFLEYDDLGELPQ